MRPGNKRIASVVLFFGMVLGVLIAIPQRAYMTSLQCETPTATPPGGAYSPSQFPLTVTLNCTTPGAGIVYTTDGSTPPSASGISCSPGDTVSVGAGQTLKARGICLMYYDSEVMSEAYTVLTCETPTANPPGGSYTTFPQSVTLSCATQGAEIHFTLDGSTPTDASPVYSGAISVNAGETIKAIAILSRYDNSAVMSETYAKSIAPPAPAPRVPSVPLVSEASGPAAHPKPNYEQAKIGRCKEWVHVRSGPGVAYDIIGQAYLGEVIELLQWDETGTWCKLLYNGGNNAGWVHGRFIVALN